MHALDCSCVGNIPAEMNTRQLTLFAVVACAINAAVAADSAGVAYLLENGAKAEVATTDSGQFCNADSFLLLTFCRMRSKEVTCLR